MSGGVPQPESFTLQALTANTTGWGPLQQLLLQTDVHVVMAQEHHLRGEDVAAASQWSIRHGWKSLWCEAEQGEGEGTKGGVVILVRSYLGLSRPPWGDQVVAEGRIVAATVEALSCRPMVVAAVYLKDGEGMSATNRALLAKLGERLRGLGHGDVEFERRASAMPYLVGADFNMSPQEVVESGWLAELDGHVFAVKSARGTCRTAGKQSNIDFFAVSNGLGKAVAEVSTVEGGALCTHVPVKLRFHPRITSLRALAIRPPPVLPTARVFGPIPAPPDWAAVRTLCTRARDCMGTSTDRQLAQSVVDAAYLAWAQLAEHELQDITGHVVDKPGLRGAPPKLIWQSIVPEKVDKPRARLAESWRQADSIARELQLAAVTAKGGGPRSEAARHILQEVERYIE